MVENKKDNGGIMAKQKRVTRKQLLKEPDEFMTTTGRIIRWGQQYARQLAYAAGAFLILMVVIAGYRYFSNNAENKAFLLLDQAVGKYETQKAGMDVLAAYEAAREDFEYIIRKYDNTEGGKLATVVFAGISYDAGDAEKAIQLYEDCFEVISNAIRPIKTFYGVVLGMPMRRTRMSAWRYPGLKKLLTARTRLSRMLHCSIWADSITNWVIRLKASRPMSD